LKTDFGFKPTYSSREVLLRYLNPEKKYLILKDQMTFSPLQVFINQGRLDDLVIDKEQLNVDALSEWLSFFEGQRSGKIHIVDPSGYLNQGKYKESPFINVISKEDLDRLRTNLESQKNYHAL
jgi:hypothetical protein